MHAKILLAALAGAISAVAAPTDVQARADTGEVFAYVDYNYKGTFQTLNVVIGTQNCYDLNAQLRGKMSSVALSNHLECIFYAEQGCKGNEFAVNYFGAPDLSKVKAKNGVSADNLAASLYCLDNPN